MNTDMSTPDKTPTRYFWKQCYGMDADTWHWALCDTDSQKEGKVSCAYMVLLADYPNGIDGKPVGEQPMPRRIVELLNNARSLERQLTRAREDGERMREALMDADDDIREHLQVARYNLTGMMHTGDQCVIPNPPLLIHADGIAASEAVRHKIRTALNNVRVEATNPIMSGGAK